MAYRSALLLSFLHATCNVNFAAADFSAILTETIFNQLAPNAVSLYSYNGFVTAVNWWNTNFPGNPVFSGSETQQRDELAAFFGNTLHEADAFKAPREYFMCQDYVTLDGDVYCKLPASQFQAATGQYCSTTHTDPATPGWEDGCNCALENPDPNPQLGENYVLAKKLYFGRGAIQLSWNYNYIDASKFIFDNSTVLCSNPELVVENSTVQWASAFWFWTANSGGATATSSTSVLTNRDFGGTVQAINSMECTSEAYASTFSQRLNYYCKAATSVGVSSLLAFNGCDLMNSTFTACTVGGTCSDCEAWISTPTSSPTASPSSSPSMSPSAAPSSSPVAGSDSPSQSPSASPTAPSASPSSSPSMSPSAAPSSSPVAGTGSPSQSPSTSPTAPSASPSSSPSMSPSAAPSSSPSQSPSTSPTAPSASPSSSPSMSPSAAPRSSSPVARTDSPSKSPSAPSASTGQYFPNWSAGSFGPHTCLLDDGSNELPAGAPLFSSLKDCCQTHYGWSYEGCMAIVNGPTNKYFPNWSGSQNVCLLDDGSNTLPDGAPLYSDIDACCATHYKWNLNQCMGVAARPTNKYFPNWSGSPNICLLDDGSNTLLDGAPLYSDIDTCCATHYKWNLNQCMGVAAGHTNKYFPNWSGSPNICLLDDGSTTVPDGAPIYDTLALCCAHHYSWNLNECNGVVTTPPPPSQMYYPDWVGSTGCLKDDGSNSVPEYMVSNPSTYMHSTGEECCRLRFSWRYSDCVENLS